jgi:hypothetical protein
MAIVFAARSFSQNEDHCNDSCLNYGTQKPGMEHLCPDFPADSVLLFFLGCAIGGGF